MFFTLIGVEIYTLFTRYDYWSFYLKTAFFISLFLAYQRPRSEYFKNLLQVEMFSYVDLPWLWRRQISYNSLGAVFSIVTNRLVVRTVKRVKTDTIDSKRIHVNMSNGFGTQCCACVVNYEKLANKNMLSATGNSDQSILTSQALHEFSFHQRIRLNVSGI